MAADEQGEAGREEREPAEKSPAAVVRADGLNDFIAATEERLDAQNALSHCEE